MGERYILSYIFGKDVWCSVGQRRRGFAQIPSFWTAGTRLARIPWLLKQRGRGFLRITRTRPDRSYRPSGLAVIPSERSASVIPSERERVEGSALEPGCRSLDCARDDGIQAVGAQRGVTRRRGGTRRRGPRHEQPSALNGPGPRSLHLSPNNLKRVAGRTRPGGSGNPAVVRVIRVNPRPRCSKRTRSAQIGVPAGSDREIYSPSRSNDLPHYCSSADGPYAPGTATPRSRR